MKECQVISKTEIHRKVQGCSAFDKDTSEFWGKCYKTTLEYGFSYLVVPVANPKFMFFVNTKEWEVYKRQHDLFEVYPPTLEEKDKLSSKEVIAAKKELNRKYGKAGKKAAKEGKKIKKKAAKKTTKKTGKKAAKKS